MSAFQGVIPILATPFHDDESIDFESWARMLEFMARLGVDGVTILGGTVRGYRLGLRIEGGRGHRVTGIDLSGSRAQRLGSTPERADSADRLDADHLATIDTYGGGMLLQGTLGATVTGVISRGAQNGIGLVDARDSYVSDNDLSGNTGWGIQL